MARSSRFDAVVVGAGFAGSLLARILASAGWRVLLVERGRHPRFAIGESSTPLANLALERIGRARGFADLVDLAAHGRWIRAYPEVSRGLKRGFSFYRHAPGVPYSPGLENERRLLVAASPNDLVADTQWLRADVDQFFVERAREAGVELIEETELRDVAVGSSGVALAGLSGGEPIEVSASLVVDGSGVGGFLQGALPIESGAPLRTGSSLIFGHFRDVPLLKEVAALDAPRRAPYPETPYPEDWAAVHHLIDEGWIYLLRFDDDLVSAGILLEGLAGIRSPVDPRRRWNRVISRYPTLEALFADATPVRSLEYVPSVQRRLARAAGPRWVVLPHTFGFVDPLFSTGIAWSLRGVERLADVLLDAGPDSPDVASGRAFDRYSERLAQEIDQLDQLIVAAYRARADFTVFAAQSLLYFALVSYEESAQRLCDLDAPWWEGFLGAGEPRGEAVAEALRRLEHGVPTDPEAFARWVRQAIEPINVAGLGLPERNNLYPVDLEDLVGGAPKLGLTEERIRTELPRLRGSG